MRTASRAWPLWRVSGLRSAASRPGVYGGKLSVVVDNTLDRQFDVDAPDRVWVTDITISERWKASPIWPW